MVRSTYPGLVLAPTRMLTTIHHLTPVPGDPIPSDLHRYQACIKYICIYALLHMK